MANKIQPDQIALEIAHKRLCLVESLEVTLKSKSLRICLENVARQHMQRRERLDVKKLQANDHD